MTLELWLIAVLAVWVLVLTVKQQMDARELDDRECNHYKWTKSSADDTRDDYYALQRDMLTLLKHLGVEFKNVQERVIVKLK